MKLDNEIQRRLLLEMVSAATFSGAALDHVYALKRAVEEADIAQLSPASDKGSDGDRTD